MSYYTKHIFVCTNQKPPGKKCCAEGGGLEAFTHLKSELVARDMHGPGKIRVSKSGCLGRCSEGPCIAIYPQGTWYTYQSLTDVDTIIQEQLIEGKPVQALLLDEQ